jgi:hypothetical protein
MRIRSSGSLFCWYRTDPTPQNGSESEEVSWFAALRRDVGGPAASQSEAEIADHVPPSRDADQSQKPLFDLLFASAML